MMVRRKRASRSASKRTTVAERFADDDSRWQAVVRRDRGADQCFCYSVRTTGVYCRPWCAARLPQRKNVRFHATPSDAERAGFRPCKRCKPNATSFDQGQQDVVARACRRIESSETVPPLAALAEAARMSPSHFHRTFKRVIGVTPKAYAAAVRAKRVQNKLAQGARVTQAIYGAGFNSSGRFYAPSNQRLGMTPTAYRTGGLGMSIRFAVGECSLGSILVAATDRGVCAILLGDEPEELVRDLHDRFPRAVIVGGDSKFDRWVAQAIALVKRPQRGLDLPLDIRGTAFQVRVWEALRKVPPGSTTTYAAVAKRIGRPTAVRAVASAIAANPIAVAVPCHRVIRTDRSLSGYRWGVERKKALIGREQKSG